MNKIKYVVMILAAFFLSFNALQVSAAKEDIPFRANLIIPEGQDEDVEDYVSLTAKDGKISKELEFQIVNNENKEKEIEIEIVDSYTSPTGVVQYSVAGPEDSSITNKDYKMRNYVLLKDNVVKLKPHESKNVKMKLNIDKLDGTILGGVSFKEKDDTKAKNDQSEKNKSDFTIKSEINIIIGIKIDFGTKQLVDLNVGEPFVEAMPAQHVVRLPMELKNSSPKKFTFDYSVEKDSSTLFEDKMKVEFAPKSSANIRLPWRAQKIEKGTIYTLKGTLTYKDIDGQEKKIDVLKKFEYKKNSAAENITEKIFSPIEERTSNIIFVIPLVGLVLGLGVLAFFVLRSKKRYYYYSDEIEAPGFIFENSELGSELTKSKKGNKKYQHTYKREKAKKGDYELIQTKEL